MTTDLQRLAVLADLERHLAPLSHDALRIVDEFALGLVQVERERPIDLESLARQAIRLDPREPARCAITAAIHCIGIGLLEQDRDRAELREQARDEMVPPQACTGLTASWCPKCGDCSCARDGYDELNSPQCPLHASSSLHAEPVNEFSPDQHLTRIDPTPEVIAPAEVPRVRDPDLEVELEWDLTDVEEPLGVHAPGGEP